MQHPDEGTIHSWLDGALSADEAARVEAHTKECPQCAAAVAEARGFIAASSRILTALDNAPRGVIPAAPSKKRIDPLVWRVAATVLVVAAGTLVVFRNGGREAQITTATADRAPSTIKAVSPMAPTADETMRTTDETAPPIKMQRSTSGSAVSGGLQRSAGSTEKSLAKSAAADALSDTAQALAALAPGVPYSAEARAPASQANIPARENKTVTGQASGAVVAKIPESSGYAGLASPTPQMSTPIRVRGAAALDVASAQLPLKVVGTPRALGAKITLYEVAGDTVTLTELLNLRLEYVVTTGITSAEPLARQSTVKSAAAKPTKRADTAAVSASDSQRVTANVAALAAAPSVLARGAQVEVANGVTTISWADATTGNVLKLSGRMPEARLQEIRIRIERERAAAAAKKSP
jgi:hypothetical protein